MLTVREYENLILGIMQKYGYEPRPISVRISPTLKSSIAYVAMSKGQFTLSGPWFSCNGATFAMHVLKHEVAHLKFRGHGAAFKQECLRMGIHGVAILKRQEGWNSPAGKSWSGIRSDWAPATYCKFEDCKRLV